MSTRTTPGPLGDEPELASPPSRRRGPGTWALAGVLTVVTWVVAQQTAPPTRPGRLLLLVAWIALLLAVLIRRWLLDAWNSLDGRRREWWVATCLGWGGVLALAVPVETGRNAASVTPIYPVGAWVAWSLLFGSLLFGAAARLTLRPGPAANPSGDGLRRWEWLALAAPSLVVWTAYLLAFWPGVMSADSLNQWGQIQSGSFTNWHPAFHTLTEWAFTRVVESPAIVAAAQVAVLSGVVGWGLAALRRLGLPMAAAWAISGAIAVWPANGITVITLWKDIPYAIGILALGLIILRELDGRSSLLNKRGGWLLLAAAASAVALYHHAGLVVAFGSLAALWLAVRRPGVIRATAATLLTVLIVQVGLYSALNFPEVGHPGIAGVTIQHIGAHLDAGTELTAQDRAEIAALIPIAEPWYNCESINSFVFNPDFSLQAMQDQAGRARALWWSLFTRNPGADLRHLACSTHLVWRIRHVPGDYQYGTQLLLNPQGEVETVAANDYGLRLDPVVGGLTAPLTDLIIETQAPSVSWLWWRGPLYLYLLLFGTAIAALRTRNWRYWAAAAPVVLVAITLILAAPVQDFRYMWPVVLSSMVLAPYLLFAVPGSADGQQQTGTNG